MKLVTAIIKPFKLEEVRDALLRAGVHGMTITAVSYTHLSEQYARLRGTRGAATLLKSNVSIYGETVKLRFKAKGGRLIEKEVHAPQLASAITSLQQLRGRRPVSYTHLELHARCADELAKAQAARVALQTMLADGGVAISRVGVDKYGGRIDATVSTRNTTDVSAAPLNGGFARSYSGGRRGTWCG